MITELLPDAEGGDKGKEWLEVHNASSAEIDLGGLDIVRTRNERTKATRIEAEDPVLLPAGGYGVLAAGEAAEGALYVYGSGLGELSNQDPTPASENGHCAPVTCRCEDGDEPSSPRDGGVTVTITEVFPNPDGTDKDREWFELHVAAERCVDLSGVRVTTDAEDPSGGHVLSAGDGGPVCPEPDTWVVAAGPSAAVGEAQAVLELGSVTLRNTNGVVALWLDAERVALAEYPKAPEGRSLQRADDDWCPSPRPAPDLSFHGTPGRPNPPCTTASQNLTGS